MGTIRVKEIMTRDPYIIKPTATVQDAAKRMKDLDCGVLPVGDASKPIGMITDRDMVLRVMAEGKDAAATSVQEVMTNKVYTCDEEDDVEDAAAYMHEHEVARLVVTKDGKVTGIVTMVELLRNTGNLQKGDRVLEELIGE